MKKYLKKVLIVTLCLCTIIGCTNIGECNAFGTTYYQIKITSASSFFGKKKYNVIIPKKKLKKYTIYEGKTSGNPGGIGKDIMGSSISGGAHYVKSGTWYEHKNGKKYKYCGYQKIRKVGDIYVIDGKTYKLRPAIKSNKVKTYVKKQAKTYVIGTTVGADYNVTERRKPWIAEMYFGKVTSIKKKWTLEDIVYEGYAVL